MHVAGRAAELGQRVRNYPAYVVFPHRQSDPAGVTSDEVPRLSRQAIEELGGLRIIQDFLALSVPMDLASGPKSDVAEMGNNRRAMTDLDVGHRLLARACAFDEVLEV